jgi:hypothetical protein
MDRSLTSLTGKPGSDMWDFRGDPYVYEIQP